jgi:hypothetical protein
VDVSLLVFQELAVGQSDTTDGEGLDALCLCTCC